MKCAMQSLRPCDSYRDRLRYSPSHRYSIGPPSGGNEHSTSEAADDYGDVGPRAIKVREGRRTTGVGLNQRFGEPDRVSTVAGEPPARSRIRVTLASLPTTYAPTATACGALNRPIQGFASCRHSYGYAMTRCAPGPRRRTSSPPSSMRIGQAHGSCSSRWPLSSRWCS